MSVLRSTLITRLESDVPAVDGVPSSTQYENAVMEAVRDFSERCGVMRIATLNIVPNTATYDLADDFLKLVFLEAVDATEGIIHSAEGLIPVSATWAEEYSIRNGQITFYPTPTFTVARDYRYKAAWIGTVIEDSGAGDDLDYETMSEREADIILLKAAMIALGKRANAEASNTIKYSFGAVSEDLTGSSDGLRKQAREMQDDYLARCDKYNGSYGIFA
jgi:hypothetical protein